MKDYETLLVELHREFIAGRPDGERADEIRDEMDVSEYNSMSRAQKLIYDNASGDLYLMSNDEEEWRKSNPLGARQGQAKPGWMRWDAYYEIEKLIEDTKYNEALTIIRGIDNLFLAKCLMANCYYKMGLLKISECFLGVK